MKKNQCLPRGLRSADERNAHVSTRTIAALICLLTPWPQAALANGVSSASTISVPVIGPVGGATLYPLNGGDSLTITGAGAVRTTAPIANSVEIIDSKNALDNSGLISTLGPTSHAILVNGQLNVINNFGSIKTLGPDSHAVYYLAGYSNVFANKGTIETVGPASYGINAIGNANNITNVGTIATIGTGGYGIFATGGISNVLINSGTISTRGSFGYGIHTSFSNSNSISNSGSIATSGNDAHGIYSRSGDMNVLANTGVIRVVASNSFGVYTQGNSNTIDNAGVIVTAGQSGYGLHARNGNSNVLINSGLIETGAWLGYGMHTWNSGYNLLGNSGSIATTGPEAHGMYSRDGDFNALNNSSVIRTAGLFSIGIFAQGHSNTLNNTGTIVTTGESAYGIHARDGNSNVLGNSGAIDTSGMFAYAMHAIGGNSGSLVNSGRIITRGSLGDAINASGNSNTVANTGSISTTGASSYGISVIGATNAVVNAGSILTTGNNARAVNIAGNQNTILNYGSIASTADGTTALYVSGNSNTVSNAGSISSVNGYAVFFDGTNNRLDSLNNYLVGRVNMGNGGTVNLSTGPNYSKLYTYEGIGLSINASGSVPLFINLAAGQASTFDPTIFSSSSDALADMTSVLSSLAAARMVAGDRSNSFWITGFGNASAYSRTATTLAFGSEFSGMAAGYDFIKSKSARFGLMAGYGRSSVTSNGSEIQSFTTMSDGGYASLFGVQRWNDLTLNVGLYGGYQSFSTSRMINNNLASSGISTASSSYPGWWISPELGLQWKAASVHGWQMIPMARLRYAHQWIGSYSETGAGVGNAVVSSRNVGIGQSFLGLGTSKSIKTRVGKDTKLVVDAQVGWIYRGVVGDSNVNVTMIGQSLSLPTDMVSRNAVGLTAGLSLDLASNVTLNLKGDYAVGGGMQFSGGGWAGLNIKF